MLTQDTPLADLLKNATHEDHRHAEARPLERLMAQGKLPLPVYVRHLVERRHVHQALDQRLEALRTTDPRAADLVHPRQYQTDNVTADLASLAPKAPGTPGTPGAPGIPGSAEATEPLPATARFIEWITSPDRPAIAVLGAHYVLEGSKNGAHMIAPRLRKAYDLTPGQGDRYLDPHGDEQRPLWIQFRETLNQLPLEPAEAEAMVEAARQTFRAISEIDDAVYEMMTQDSVSAE